MGFSTHKKSILPALFPFILNHPKRMNPLHFHIVPQVVHLFLGSSASGQEISMVETLNILSYG
jgi:hypothetical protein